VRRLLTILLVISVIWCGLELCPPALAHAGGDQVSVNASPADSADPDNGPLEAVHAGNHHCPLATQPDDAARSPARDGGSGLRPSARIHPLASRDDAPRLQPPAA
jgi:hypothetical protein